MEYWIIEWSYTHEAVDRYIENHPGVSISTANCSEQKNSYKVDVWNTLNTTNHTFEFCFAVMKERVHVLEHVYHWRIRDLHSGDTIPGEAL